MNNRDLVRALVGDRGVAMQDVASGDGATTIMYLSTPPIATDGLVVLVGGAAKTENTDFTIDRTSGKITFTAAPGAAEDNVTVDYLAVKIRDALIDDILVTYGYTATATASVSSTGPEAALLRAAAEIADSIAAEMSERTDVSSDGQSLSRSQAAKAYAEVADRLRERARRKGGLVAVRQIRKDAYNADDDTDNQASDGSTQNPRRRFYGERDRLP